MISKKELLEYIEKRIFHWKNRDEGRGNTFELCEFREWVKSLPDDEPDLLPFQWPVLDGYQAVYVLSDTSERVVTPICSIDPDNTVCVKDENGYLSLADASCLFLRRKEKKVWVVELPDGELIICDNKPEKENDIANIYEATLKPVV